MIEPGAFFVVKRRGSAGIEHFIFVTGRNKGVIEDHFDRQFELEITLRERQKHAALEYLKQDLPVPGSASFTRQGAARAQPRGVVTASNRTGEIAAAFFPRRALAAISASSKN